MLRKDDACGYPCGRCADYEKTHPCGSKEMVVLRSGMDFKLRCSGCGHEFMVPRSKIEKNIKAVKREEPEQ